MNDLKKTLHPNVPRVEGESNWDWCKREAAAMSAELLAAALLRELAKAKKTSVYLALGHAISNGSGVTQAVLERLGVEDV